jgi:hypothetical protein
MKREVICGKNRVLAGAGTGRVHHLNAHTTQPLNLEFEDLNNTTLQK